MIVNLSIKQGDLVYLKIAKRTVIILDIDQFQVHHYEVEAQSCESFWRIDDFEMWLSDQTAEILASL
jgi:hypothetical protein